MAMMASGKSMEYGQCAGANTPRERTKADAVNSALSGLASAIEILEGFIQVNVTGDLPPRDKGQTVGYADGPALEAFLSTLPSRIAELEKRVHGCRERLHDALVKDRSKEDAELARRCQKELKRQIGDCPDPAGYATGGPAHG